MNNRLRKIALPSESGQHILVISGASGSGKTTACALLEWMYPDKYTHIPFDRTRANRPGEFGSRQVDYETMLQNYQNGEYFNLAQVTHGGYAAMRTADINQALWNGKTAVLEYPIEAVDVLENTFDGANVTSVELIAPNEQERHRRLIKDNKYTDYRIESDKFGSGRIAQYKSGQLLNPGDHNLVLISETGNLDEVVQKIHKYMEVQRLTPMQLAEIEKSGVAAVQNLLRAVDIGKHESLETDEVDKELFVDRLGLQ